MKKLTPLKSIRAECLNCSETTTQVVNCDFVNCVLFPYRMGKKLLSCPPKFKVLKSIRLYCLEYCCGNRYEVKLCPITNCPLYIYRFGKNPNIKKVGNIDNLRPYWTGDSKKPCGKVGVLTQKSALKSYINDMVQK